MYTVAYHVYGLNTHMCLNTLDAHPIKPRVPPYSIQSPLSIKPKVPPYNIESPLSIPESAVFIMSELVAATYTTLSATSDIGWYAKESYVI